MSEVLARIARVVEERKSADPSTSYVASLLARSPDAILQKLGEETTELVIAAKNGERQAIVHETADLWFHTLVLLGACGVGQDEVMAELERRFGVSGIEEKAARGRQPAQPTAPELTERNNGT